MLSTVPPTDRLAALLDTLHEQRVPVRWGHLGEQPAVPAKETHQLRARTGRRDARDAVLMIAGGLAPRRHRVALAAKFDPWLKRELRRSTVVVALDQDAAAALQVLGSLAPQVRTAGPRDAEAVLGAELADRQLRTAVRAAHVRERGSSEPTAVQPVLAALTQVARDQLPVPELPGKLENLLADLTQVREHDALLEVTRACSAVTGLGDDALVTGYRTLAELGAHAATGADVHAVAGAVLAAADRALDADDLTIAARRAALAADLLFHRELHSDGETSTLVDHPAETLSVLRSTRVGALLTRASAEPVPRPPRRRAPVRVTVLPGPFGSFEAPVVRALEEFPDARVRTLDLRGTFPGFRSLAVDPALFEERLRYALGREPSTFARMAQLLRDTDVIVADWAAKAALLASLHAPADARLVLRVHSVDLLRPWLHLIDWARVDELVCVSPATAGLVRDLLGDRLAAEKVHVLPPLIDVTRFDRPQQAADRTLCMVGWAQRVKDPLWAVEVLARLRAEDPTWRLLLIGADFPARPTASGREYAAAFRARAMADDVRDHISYVGYTTDLPTHLQQAGYVLSTSVREGFPVALAEAAAAGAVPVVRDWPMFAGRGATGIYPDDWVVRSVEEAVARIWATCEHRDEASAAVRRTIREIADPDGTADTLRRLVLGEPAELADLVRRGEDEQVGARITAILERDSVTPLLLRSASRAAHTIGAMTQRFDVLDRLVQEHPDPGTLRMLRGQLGRLRETSASWVPEVPEPAEPVVPVPGRILHVLKNSRPARQSGYAMRSWYTLAEQRRLGLDAIGVTALDFPDSPGAGGAADEPEDVGGVPHYRLLRAHRPEREPVDEYLTAWAAALAPLVERLRPSVLHVHSGHRGYEPALVALAIGRAYRVPVVYEVRGFFESLWRADPVRAERGEAYQRRRETEARCMHAAAAVVTLSESMRADILARGIDPTAVSVVPNAVDPAAFPLQERSPALVDQHGLAGRFVFGYVSNLDHPREGHEMLIQAAVRLRQAGIAVTALIVGDGRRRAELEALTAELDATDVVLFTGSVPHEQVQDYYRLCDVFVIPRVAERAARLVTPLKPYEAMALGIPVIVSDVEALLEVIGHGERGDSFHAGRSDDLVQALLRAHQHPEDLARKAVRARDWVCSARTWASNAVRYREIYDRLPPVRATPAPESIGEDELSTRWASAAGRLPARPAEDGQHR